MSRRVGRHTLQIVARTVAKHIADNTDRNSKYSKGLASEGYAGGYLQALRDVELALYSGVQPQTRGWWNKVQT